MSEVLTSCKWKVEGKHIVEGNLIEFLEMATQLGCEIWLDWRAENIEKGVKILVVKAPSEEVSQALATTGKINLGLTDWNEIRPEYYQHVTDLGKLPSLQSMRMRDSHYFGEILEGFLTGITNDHRSNL